MAQYYTDFSEYTTGVQPSDFTERWDAAAATSTVETVLGTTGGKVLEVVATGGPAALSWDKIDSDPDRADVEILTRTRRMTSRKRYTMGVLARGVNAEATRTGYIPTIGEDYAIDRYLSGSFSSLSTAFFIPTFEVWYYLRVRFNGTSIKLRAWSGAIVDEPATWDLETTNSDIAAAGWVGFFNFSDITVEYDILSVGTNGDSAPSTAPATGPETPVSLSVTDILATSARLTWDQG